MSKSKNHPQLRIERARLWDIDGYMGQRLAEIARDCPDWLGGRTEQEWLREVAAATARVAERTFPQPELY